MRAPPCQWLSAFRKTFLLGKRFCPVSKISQGKAAGTADGEGLGRFQQPQAQFFENDKELLRKGIVSPSTLSHLSTPTLSN